MALRTIELDENLLRDAMDAATASDAREFIETHLREMIRRREAQRALLELRGKVQWEGNLSDMRRNRHLFPDEE